MACVSTWHLHQTSRESLCDFRHFRQDIDVQLDAKINGKISVVVDQDQAQMSLHASPTRPPTQTSPTKPKLNSSPARKLTNTARPMTPNRDLYSFEPRGDSPIYGNSPSAPQNYGLLSSNGPKFAKAFKTPERKVERRTSVCKSADYRISFMRHYCLGRDLTMDRLIEMSRVR